MGSPALVGWLVLRWALPWLTWAGIFRGWVAWGSRAPLSMWCFLIGSLCHGCLRASFQEGELGGLRSPEAEALEHTYYHLCRILLVEVNWKAGGREKRLTPFCFLPVLIRISNSSQTSRKGLEIDSLKAGFISQQCCNGPRFLSSYSVTCGSCLFIFMPVASW